MSEHSLIHSDLVMTRAKPLPPDQRRASLIEATRQLILEHGPDVTTRQVAKAAGVAEGTLFRVFPTRRDLIAATIADQLSPERLEAALDATPPASDLDEATERCLSTAVEYVTTCGRLIPQPIPDDTQDSIRFQLMEQWKARVGDITSWMRTRLAPYEAELNIPLDDFVHLVATLSMGYVHNKRSATRLNPETLARLALDGARRKESH
jgi:transcription regulator